MNPLVIVMGYDLWRLGTCIGMYLCLFYFIFQQSKKIGLFPAITWGYVLGSALFIMELPWLMPFGLYNNAFIATAGQSFVEALMIPFIILSLPEKHIKYVWNFFIVLICAEIVFVWLKLPGVMIAPSFNTALIAMFIPFAPLWLSVASVITILAHHGSTAMLVLIAQCTAVAFCNKKIQPYAIASIPIIIVFMAIHSHTRYLDGSERLIVWKSMLGHWWDGTTFTSTNPPGVVLRYGGTLVSKLFGTGSGSWMWLSMMTEPSHMFLSAHSEYVEILFETGFVGTILTLGTALKAILNTINKPKILAAILGVLACALTYHPFRFSPSAILVCMMFREAFIKRKRPEK